MLKKDKVKKSKNKEEKQPKITKKTKKQIIIYVLIALGVCLIGCLVSFFLYQKNVKPKKSAEATKTVKKEDKTNSLTELKTELTNQLTAKLTQLKEYKCTGDNCLKDETKTEMTSKLDAYLKQVDEAKKDEEALTKLQQEITEYLTTVDKNLTTSEKSTTDKDKTSTTKKTTNSQTTNKTTSSQKTTSSSNNASLETLLNNAPLSPLKTGYPAVDSAVESVLNSQTNSSMSTYQKVMAIYDWLAKVMTYAVPMIYMDDVQSIADEYALAYNDAQELYLAEDGFDSHYGSCDTYSAMFMIITRRIGLDSYTISAKYGNGGHTTVNIKLNGAWYNFDAQGDAKQKAKGKNYYFLGQNEAQMKKAYSAIYRSESVARFKKFAKQDDLLKTSIYINGKTYNAQTSSSITKKDTNIMDVAYNKGAGITINVSASTEVSTYWEFDDTTYIFESYSGHDGKVTNGPITANIDYPGRGYLKIRLTDGSGRHTDYMIRINAIENGSPFMVNSNVSDASYADYFYIGANAINGSGEAKFSAKILETDDPNVGNIIIEEGDRYPLVFKNVKTYEYYYKIEVTAVDAVGNVATTIHNFDSRPK